MAEVVDGIVGQVEVDAGNLPQQLAALRSAMDQVEAELQDLHGGFAQTGQAAAVTGLAIGDLAQKKVELKAHIDRVTAAMREQAPAAAGVQAGMRGVSQASGKSMDDVGRNARMAQQRLMVMGQTLDDLQYVGEMGLRPIINNLMQMSPKLGIAAILTDQLIKRWDALVPVAKAVAEYWVGTFDKAAASTQSALSPLQAVQAALAETTKFVAELTAGWNALTKAQERGEAARIAKFLGEATPDDKKRGGNMGTAIDAYGRGRLMDEMIRERGEQAPGFKEDLKDPDTLRREQARIVDLIERARKGDEAAMDALVLGSRGTGLGTDLDLARRGTGKAQAEAQKAEDRTLKQDQDAEAATAQKAVDGAVKALQDRFDRGMGAGATITPETIAREIQRSGLPQSQQMQGPVYDKLRANYESAIGERAAQDGVSFDEARRRLAEDQTKKAAASNAEALQERFNRATAEGMRPRAIEIKGAMEAAGMTTGGAAGVLATKRALQDNYRAGIEARAAEKGMTFDAAEKDLRAENRDRERDSLFEGNDLNRRLQDLRRPQSAGQSMSVEAYEASIKTEPGDKQLRKLEDIYRAQTELLAWQKRHVQIAVVKKR